VSFARPGGRSVVRSTGTLLFSLGVFVGAGLAFGACGGGDNRTSDDASDEAGPDTGARDAAEAHDASADDGGRGQDAGGSDANDSDGGASDAHDSDAGASDARPLDDGRSETGAPDTGGSDGGTAGDAEAQDGGVDARADAEAGTPTDAGADDANGDAAIVDSSSPEVADGGTCTIVPSFNVSCPTACNGAQNYCVGGGVPTRCLPIPTECLCEETHTCACLLALIPSPCDGGILRCTSGGPTGELFVTASSCQ
jgi:hypothetical protein